MTGVVVPAIQTNFYRAYSCRRKTTQHKAPHTMPSMSSVKASTIIHNIFLVIIKIYGIKEITYRCYSGVSFQLNTTTVETISISVRNDLTSRMFESKAARHRQHFTH